MPTATVQRTATVTVEAQDGRRWDQLADLLAADDFAVQTDHAPSPDVAILDLASTARGGLRRVRSLHAALPDTRIVVVATPARGHDARLLIGAGADGLVPAADARRALAATVHAVLAGQVCLPRDFRAQAAHPACSHREKQVLSLMAAGATNRQIGEALFLTESTVKSHLVTAFAKLGVRTRAEAALALAHEREEHGA